jgi:hypothetical protein
VRSATVRIEVPTERLSHWRAQQQINISCPSIKILERTNHIGAVERFLWNRLTTLIGYWADEADNYGMSISWLLGIPFAGVFDPRFLHTLPLVASPSPSLVVVMLGTLLLMGLTTRRALNY